MESGNEIEAEVAKERSGRRREKGRRKRGRDGEKGREPGAREGGERERPGKGTKRWRQRGWMTWRKR